jgi:hypothetical protein
VRLDLSTRCRPVAGSESGQIVLVGHDPRRVNAPVAERWPSADASTLADLPRPRAHEDRDLCAVTAGAREAWAWGNGRLPYLARFDGAAWAREEPPVHDNPLTMVGRDDGAVFFVVPYAVYLRLSGSASWEQLVLPGDSHPFTSAAVVAGKLWLATSDQIFGPVAPPEVVEMPAYTVEKADPPRAPLTEACATPYVLLQARVPPAKAEYPDVVARMKEAIPLDGVTLATEMVGRFTHLGARVPSVAVAKKLAAALHGSAHCYTPKVLKTIPLSP